MKTRVKAALNSLWLWVAVAFIGGCMVGEGLRQCAHVEMQRAQQQQQRADEIRQLAAEAQNAMMVVRGIVPEDDKSGLAELVSGIEKTQGMIVERAVAIEAGAKRSEEWQSADSQTVGRPKQPLAPDTTQEDDARTDFQRRARTAARIRGAANSLRAVITGRPIQLNAQSGSSSNGWAATLFGLAVAVVGGGGAAATAGRRLLRNVKQTVEGVTAKDQERDDKDSERERRHSEMEEQIRILTGMVAQVQESLADQAQAPASSSPSQPG